MVYKLECPDPGFWNKAPDLFQLESKHATSLKNLDDLKSRRDLVNFILKVKQYCNLDPMLTYLAINYVDRYLHKKPFAQGETAELMATACLSCAAHTLGSYAFSPASLKEEDGFKQLDAKALSRAKFEVRDCLEWDLKSITPIAYLHFLAYYMSSSDDLTRFDALNARASEILIRLQPENEGILEYSASVIAAAALFCAVEELFPQKLPAYIKDVYSCQLVDKATVAKLYPEMKSALESSRRADKKRPIEGSSESDEAANKKRQIDDDVDMEEI